MLPCFTRSTFLTKVIPLFIYFIFILRFCCFKQKNQLTEKNNQMKHFTNTMVLMLHLVIFLFICSSGNIFFCNHSACCAHHTMLQIQDRGNFSLKRLLQWMRKFDLGIRSLHYINSYSKWACMVYETLRQYGLSS